MLRPLRNLVLDYIWLLQSHVGEKNPREIVAQLAENVRVSSLHTSYSKTESESTEAGSWNSAAAGCCALGLITGKIVRLEAGTTMITKVVVCSFSNFATFYQIQHPRGLG